MSKFKQGYLMLLIVVSLFSLAIYSTYAMFEAEIDTNNIVSIDTSISVDTSIEEYQITTIEPNNYKILSINLTNSQDISLYYGVWIEKINANNNDISAYKLDDSKYPTVDIINNNETRNITIVIINNSQKKATIKLGVATSQDTSLNINGNRILVSEEIARKDIRNQTAAEFITNLYTEDSTELYYDKNKNLLYYGANPNNHIIINQEMWQIIGVYNNKLKLIKENSIGNYQYDSNLKYYQNSKINNLLNELYYKSAKGTCYQDNLEKECDFTNTGLTKETISLLDMQTVNNETTSIENKENFKESQITITNTFETNISLPSITDYINTLYCKEENTCNTSWMTKPGTLLLTLNNINNNLYTMSIIEDGSIKIDNDATTNLEVRPVIILKEENYIIKGNGTQDTPYILK
jgi:hypothetical protein